MVSLASRAPQRLHFRRAGRRASSVDANCLITSKAVIVRELPQRPHSTFSAVLKRTRSAAVRMCLVDIHRELT